MSDAIIQELLQQIRGKSIKHKSTKLVAKKHSKEYKINFKEGHFMKLKKIISMLTTALIIATSVSVTDVSAAVKPKKIKIVTNANKKKSKHTLALGEVKAIKSAGKATANVRFSPKNSSKGFRVTSDDSSVVKVQHKNPQRTSWTMTGMGTGSATLTIRSAVKASLKATLDVTVTSRPPERLEVSKSSFTMLPNQTISIGSMSPSSDVNVTFNNTKVDRFIKVTSSDDSIVTASKENNKKFTLKALKAGTANITVASATDSSVKSELTVTVKSTEPQLSFTAKQSKKDRILVTFANPMTSTPSLSSFKLRQKGATWDVALNRITMSNDGKSAYIDTYIDLTANVTYELTFTQANNQTQTTEFTGSDNKPVKIVVHTKTVPINYPKKLRYSLFDANDVDVTDANMSKVDVAIEDPRFGFYNSYDKTITMYQAGTSLRVKLTYHTGVFSNTHSEQTLVETATITALPVSDITVIPDKFIIKDGPGKLSDSSWNSAISNPAVPALTQNAYLAVRVKTSENELYASDANYPNINFTFESKHPDILTIDNNGKITLSGNAQAGKQAVVVIKATIENKSFSYTTSIDILQESIPSNVVLSPNPPLVKIGGQALTVQLKILDQYGLDITQNALNKISITPKIQQGGTLPSITLSSPTYDSKTNKATFTVQANPGSPTGNMYYDIISLSQQNRSLATLPVIVLP